MAPFATLSDLILLWRPLQPGETDRAEALLVIVSDSLRIEAERVGRDLDQQLLDQPAFGSVLRSVVVDVVSRALMTSTEAEPAVSATESALGYSRSVSYLVPGGGLFIKNSELSRLGLRAQRIGSIEMFGKVEGRNLDDLIQGD